MPEWLIVILYTLVAGGAIGVGGLLARIESLGPSWLEEEFRHGVIAFGGGVLLSAVALVLVPEGARHLEAWVAVGCLLAGGALMCAIDIALARRGTSGSQLVAALSDFIPEAVALGATAAGNARQGLLLALLITLQNLPEGFNAYRDLTDAGERGGRVLRLFALLALTGPCAGLLGYVLLAQHDAVTGVIMLFGAGGILYLMFQDLAPQAKLERHWLPTLGGVLGFGAGLLGQMLVEG
ncbi:MAG: divalent cation transporter [Phycisphaerales bacterium]